MTATTTTAKAAQVTMRNGFEGALISVASEIQDIPSFQLDEKGAPIGVDMMPTEIWIVTVIGLYSTSRGDQVGEVKTRSFNNEASAREHANGWFASLVRKGYRRTV